MKGMPVANGLNAKSAEHIAALKQNGVVPKLAIVRVGEREDDLAYERGIVKRFASVDALAEVNALPLDATQGELEAKVASLNNDPSVHGIIVFRPLPKHLSLEPVKAMINPSKDVDCMGSLNTARLFEGDKNSPAPCTPQAVVELLDFYGIDVAGKNAVIVGRSLVVGKPLAMLLLGKNATVTVCHTKTENLPEVCKRADVLVACAGAAGMIREEHTHAGQVVVDVGINMLNGKLCGDVDFEAVADKVKAITPVPGGVGAVTTSVLLKHTVLGALGARTFCPRR